MTSSARDTKLANQIVEEFHAAGQRGDINAFKQLLGKYGAHLSTKIKNDLIADFQRNATLLQNSLRGK